MGKRSKFLTLNLRDALKGLFLVVITAIITGVYELVATGAVFAWTSLKPILLTAAAAALSYIIKNFLTNSNGEILTKEK
jgi:hypothetical protein